MATERVAIIGAGVAGLAAALALKDSGRGVVILERDPEPPAIAPSAAFELWPRPGVPQFRHAHVFLGRLHTILRTRHPALLGELLQAGLELAELVQMLPPTLRDDAPALPGDDELLHLWGRRATFEYVLRQHVARLPHVRFIHGARAVGLTTESDGRALRVRGVEITRDGGARERIEADVVVDAAGKSSRSAEWLTAAGVTIAVERAPSGYVYACRHYRLKDPKAAPPRRDGGANLDYVGYSIFYAEHGHHALAFSCPVEEQELARTIHSADGFRALCKQVPVLERWTEASEPTTKVFGAGRFENRWTQHGAAGGLALHGFFATGDAQLETNPMYGRGCASAFVQAEVLAETLATSADAGERAQRYAGRTRALLYPYYEVSVTGDRLYHVRASQRRGERVPLQGLISSFLYEHAFVPASYRSLFVTREFMKVVQMGEASAVWRRLAVIAHVGIAMLRSVLGLGRAYRLAQPPPREKFLRDVAAELARVLRR